jgi:uncharacterized protein YbjT (DUF2867 family)
MDERSAQILSRTTQAGVHGVEIAAEHVGDLGRAHALELGEDEHLASLGAQGVDRRGDSLETMTGVGCALHGPHVLRLGQRGEPTVVPLERASSGCRDPPCDAAQPRPDRPVVPSPKPAMHDHEHVLGRVLEILGGHAERPQRPPHEREVLGIDRLEPGRELGMVVSGHPLLTISSFRAFCPGHAHKHTADRPHAHRCPTRRAIGPSMTNAPVLVCGATGQVGVLLRAALDTAGVPWLGLSRRPPASERWRQADLEQPATLGPVLDGVGTVFLASSDHPRQDELEIAMIEACRARGIARVVKLSAQSAGLEPPVSFGVLHARAERVLRESGMAWSILRPVFFMQSLLLMADSVRGGKLIAATGKGEVAFVDTRDIADVAARVLASPSEHDGKLHTLTGPRALSFAALAELLASATGQPVRHISPPRVVARLVLPWVSGMARWRSNLVVDLMAAIANGAQSVPSDAVRQITGHEPRTIESFIAEQRAIFTKK